MAIQVFLEIGLEDGHRAHLLDLPGCTVKGRTRDRLMAAIPQNAVSHLAWLRSHGEEFNTCNDMQFSITEEKEITRQKNGYEVRAWFSWDGKELKEAEFLRWLKLLSHANNDLAERIMALPCDILDWYPAAFRHRSIKEIVFKVVEGAGWCLSRLKEDPNTFQVPVCSGTMSEYLAVVRTKAMSMLYFIFEHDRTRRFKHQGEEWSLRKSMRRYLELTLESLKEIDTIASLYWRKCNEGILLKNPEIITGREPVFANT